MKKIGRKKEVLGNKEIILSLMLLSFLIIGTIIKIPAVIGAPPTPHGISGYIYYSDGTTQVPLGTPFYINDTTSGFFVQDVTKLPIPGYSGYYSKTIQGVDGDNVVVRAWNKTHYGERWVVLSGNMDNINVSLNLTRGPEPTVNITSPPNNSQKNTSDYFEVLSNLTLYGGNGVNCTTTISFSNSSILSTYNGQPATIDLGNLSRGYNSIITWNLSGIGVGSSNVTVNFTCGNEATVKFEALPNKDTLNNITIIDTTPPNITLAGPADDSWTNNENVSFQYNVSDISGLKNCSLYVDSSLMQSELLPATDTMLYFNETLSEGSHLWNITCYDNSPQENYGISQTWNISIDTISPSIEIINPLNNTARENNTVDFQYRIIEDGSGINYCALLINGTTYFLDYNIQNNTVVVNNQYLVMGNYYWQVNCYDNATNNQVSPSTYFTILDPDLSISTSRISINYSSLIEGQEANITANISNLGNQNASDVILQFFLGDPDTGGTQIGSNQTISFIDGYQTVLISQLFNLIRGINNIFVVVDPPIATNGSISELNESNNKANNSVFVSSWQIYFGNTMPGAVLGANTSALIIWNTSNQMNMLFVEDGTVFDWSSLQALGKDTNNNSASNDFLQADTELNLTGYPDSIYDIFTNSGTPKKTDGFTINNISIQNVPVANSTNNSNFETGILWDYSDGGSEYNGTQDLIFVTKTNNDQQGGYGIYDYEVRVPATLSDYKLGAGSISIYTEII